MKTKKPNTLQQKLGFQDEDLKKPKHDDMMLWLDKNAESIFNDIFFKHLTDVDYNDLLKYAITKKDKVIEDRREIIKSLEKRIENAKDSKSPFDALTKEKEIQILEDLEREKSKVNYLESWTSFESLPPRPKVSIISKVWELPVTTHSNNPNSNSSKYTVGFLDMAIHFQIHHPYAGGFADERHGDKWLSDIKGKIEIDFQHQQSVVYVEAKTEIASLGELIRQIRHYKEYLPGSYYVLCPDDKYQNTLKEQNIGFIKYKE
ncbi:hypothetical protein [Ohtaekwangia koreensis]|uniref:Uncharacterized protein n=1 Tax=Ohtaekwangia koreensis TaxID=688867 RepID=A0A1T5J7Z8_9BACT|nr:hypothetical protein [Ohtaekwangia koreensis]SKC47464.1 hypothetical protein SAMN05660236_0852 [Ohtaekwangia koreensis]